MLRQPFGPKGSFNGLPFATVNASLQKQMARNGKWQQMANAQQNVLTLHVVNLGICQKHYVRN